MEEPQSKTCHCFFVADNVLNKQRLTLGRIMTSVHIKTEDTGGNRGAYHSIFFSLPSYRILEASKIVFSCNMHRTLFTKCNYSRRILHIIKKTVHSDGGGGLYLIVFENGSQTSVRQFHIIGLNLLIPTKHEPFLAASSREWKDYWVWCVWVSNLMHDHHIRYNSLFLLDLAPMMTSRLWGYLLQAQ
jgi:hypothetical protein